MNILLIPGLNSTGYSGNARSSALAVSLKAISHSAGCTFHTVSLLDFKRFDTMSAQVEELLENTEPNTTVVASSFGVWLLLKALSRTNWVNPPFRHLVLANPFTEVRSIYEVLPPLVREIPSYTGFWRKGGHGVKGFWTPPSLVRDMLDDANDIYDGRLKNLTGCGQRITLVSNGKSYAPPSSILKLAKALNIAETDVVYPEQPHLSRSDIEGILA